MDESTVQKPLLFVSEREADSSEYSSTTRNATNTSSKSGLIIAMLLASNILLACGWAATVLQSARHHRSTGQQHHQSLVSGSSTTTLLPSHQQQQQQQQRQQKEMEEEQEINNAIAIQPTLPSKPVQFHWYTGYSSPNRSVSDTLWDNINTAYGHVGLDHTLAAQQHWPYSMPIPGNETKGLYLLESYHQLHCLKIVRKLFFELQDQNQDGNDQRKETKLSYPVQHARHCFDAFRQFIMCHADNTPLYTLGRHTSGDGQWHMCKDWSALRRYAHEKSACFRDRTGNETLREQFGHCGNGDDDDDGLLLDPEVLDLTVEVSRVSRAR